MNIEDKRFAELIQKEHTLTLINNAYWRLKPNERDVFLKGILLCTDWSPITPEVMSNAE